MPEPHPEFPDTIELNLLMGKLTREPSEVRETVADVVAEAILSRDTAALARLSIVLDAPSTTGLANGWVEAKTFKTIVEHALQKIDEAAAEVLES